MIKRAIAALLTATALVGAAHADANYTVFAPTVEPYERFQNFVAPGNFSDSFDFTLNQASSGYIWLFARQDAWFGFNAVENTTAVTLTLVNNDTEKEWFGVLLPTVKGYVSVFSPGALDLTIAGFDPNKSLYLGGDFTAGHYTAFVEGLANGINGSSYIAKFSLTPTVPEPSDALMMALGLGGIALAVRRMRNIQQS
jgi:hypothetical protein